MGVVTVTSENLAEFQESFNKVDEVAASGDEVAAKETEKEAPKEDKEEKPQKQRGKLDQRFSELTQRIRDAEARAAAAEAKAREYEAKSAPKEEKKDDGIGPEPDAKSYTDAFDYARDLAKWETAKALKARDEADAKKRAEEESAKVLKAWQNRLNIARAEIEDFDDIVASSTLSVSDLVKDTIIESDFGPELLYHFASDDDEAEKLNEMTTKQALKYLGRLESRFEAKKEAKGVKAEAAKDELEAKEPAKPKRPPEPTTPIVPKGGIDTRTDAKGEFKGTFAEYKALRLAGKI